MNNNRDDEPAGKGTRAMAGAVPRVVDIGNLGALHGTHRSNLNGGAEDMRQGTKRYLPVILAAVTAFLSMGIDSCGEPFELTGFTGTFSCHQEWGDNAFDYMDSYYDLYQYADGDLICWFTDWTPEDDIFGYDLEELDCRGVWSDNRFQWEMTAYYYMNGVPVYCTDVVNGTGIDDDGDGYYDRLEGHVFGDCPDGLWDKVSDFSGKRTWTPNPG